ncbi:conserved Plasmodium protein, unknown function [Plasmodium gallinaceum]|uniref:Uncharacterized protein n=1 Tax=Plasmodium gallinaceum TaxID=5849 RepID=A0A1J1GZS0_PLAGA|nr:conserved Plasmodium protein, unknown function [Plasmodium gallinaceum]CRG98118.1 conserved Plasmodium protein, unknown function [Plasmodium gallinaceum]
MDKSIYNFLNINENFSQEQLNLIINNMKKENKKDKLHNAINKEYNLEENTLEEKDFYPLRNSDNIRDTDNFEKINFPFYNENNKKKNQVYSLDDMLNNLNQQNSSKLLKSNIKKKEKNKKSDNYCNNSSDVYVNENLEKNINLNFFNWNKYTKNDGKLFTVYDHLINEQKINNFKCENIQNSAIKNNKNCNTVNLEELDKRIKINLRNDQKLRNINEISYEDNNSFIASLNNFENNHTFDYYIHDNVNNFNNINNNGHSNNMYKYDTINERNYIFENKSNYTHGYNSNFVNENIIHINNNDDNISLTNNGNNNNNFKNNNDSFNSNSPLNLYKYFTHKNKQLQNANEMYANFNDKNKNIIVDDNKIDNFNKVINYNKTNNNNILLNSNKVRNGNNTISKENEENNYESRINNYNEIDHPNNRVINNYITNSNINYKNIMNIDNLNNKKNEHNMEFLGDYINNMNLNKLKMNNIDNNNMNMNMNNLNLYNYNNNINYDEQKIYDTNKIQLINNLKKNELNELRSNLINNKEMNFKNITNYDNCNFLKNNLKSSEYPIDINSLNNVESNLNNSLYNNITNNINRVDTNLSKYKNYMENMKIYENLSQECSRSNKNMKPNSYLKINTPNNTNTRNDKISDSVLNIDEKKNKWLFDINFEKNNFSSLNTFMFNEKITNTNNMYNLNIKEDVLSNIYIDSINTKDKEGMNLDELINYGNMNLEDHSETMNTENNHFTNKVNYYISNNEKNNKNYFCNSLNENNELINTNGIKSLKYDYYNKNYDLKLLKSNINLEKSKFNKKCITLDSSGYNSDNSKSSNLFNGRKKESKSNKDILFDSNINDDSFLNDISLNNNKFDYKLGVIMQNIRDYSNRVFNDLFTNNDPFKKKKINEMNLYLSKLRGKNCDEFFFNLNKFYEIVLMLPNLNYLYKYNSSILYSICVVTKNLLLILHLGVYIFHIIKTCMFCIVKLILIKPVSITDKVWFFLLNLYRCLFEKLYEYFQNDLNNENSSNNKVSLGIILSFTNVFNETLIEYSKIRVLSRNKKKEEFIAFPLYESLKPFFFVCTNYPDEDIKSEDDNLYEKKKNEKGNKFSKENIHEKGKKTELEKCINNFEEKIKIKKNDKENEKEYKEETNKKQEEQENKKNSKENYNEKQIDNLIDVGFISNIKDNDIHDKNIENNNIFIPSKINTKKKIEDELSVSIRSNILCCVHTLIKMFSHIYINNWDKILYYYNEKRKKNIPIFISITLSDRNQKLRANAILCLKYLFDCKQLKYWFLLKDNNSNNMDNNISNANNNINNANNNINNVNNDINIINNNNDYMDNISMNNKNYSFNFLNNRKLFNNSLSNVENNLTVNKDELKQNGIISNNINNTNYNKSIYLDTHEEANNITTNHYNSNMIVNDTCNYNNFNKKNSSNISNFNNENITLTELEKNKNNLYDEHSKEELNDKVNSSNMKIAMTQQNVIKIISTLIKLIIKTYVLDNKNNFYTAADRLNIYRFFLRVSQSISLTKFKILLFPILKIYFFYLLKYLIYFNHGDVFHFCIQRLLQNNSNLNNKVEINNSNDFFINNEEKCDKEKNDNNMNDINSFYDLQCNDNFMNSNKNKHINCKQMNNDYLYQHYLDEDDRIFSSLNNYINSFKENDEYDYSEEDMKENEGEKENKKTKEKGQDDNEEKYTYDDEEMNEENEEKEKVVQEEEEDKEENEKKNEKIKKKNKNEKKKKKGKKKCDDDGKESINVKNKNDENKDMENIKNNKVKKICSCKNIVSNVTKNKKKLKKKGSNDVAFLYKNIDKINKNLLSKEDYRLLINILYCNEYSKNSKYICTITVIINIFSVLLCEYNDDMYYFLCSNIYGDNINNKLNNHNIYCGNLSQNYLYNISFAQLIYFMLIFLYKIFYQPTTNRKDVLTKNLNVSNINDNFYLHKNDNINNVSDINNIDKLYFFDVDSKSGFENFHKENYKYEKRQMLSSYNDLYDNYIISYMQKENNDYNNLNVVDKNNSIPYDIQIFKNIFLVFQKTLKYYLFCYMHCWKDVKNLLEYFLQSENINIKVISIKIVIDIFGFINSFYDNNCNENELSIDKQKDEFKNSYIFNNMQQYLLNENSEQFKDCINSNLNSHFNTKYVIPNKEDDNNKSSYDKINTSILNGLYKDQYNSIYNDFMNTKMENDIDIDNKNINNLHTIDNLNNFTSTKYISSTGNIIHTYDNNSSNNNIINNNDNNANINNIINNNDNNANINNINNNNNNDANINNINNNNDNNSNINNINNNNDNNNNTSNNDDTTTNNNYISHRSMSNSINSFKSVKSISEILVNKKKLNIIEQDLEKRIDINNVSNKKEIDYTKLDELDQNDKKKKFIKNVENDMIYLFRKYILIHIHNINKIHDDVINKRSKVKHIFLNTIICISQLSYEGFKILQIEDIQKLTNLVSSCVHSIKCNIITALSKYIIKYIFAFNKKFIQNYEKKINLLHMNSTNVYYNNILMTTNNFNIKKNLNIDVLSNTENVLNNKILKSHRNEIFEQNAKESMNYTTNSCSLNSSVNINKQINATDSNLNTKTYLNLSNAILQKNEYNSTHYFVNTDNSLICDKLHSYDDKSNFFDENVMSRTQSTIYNSEINNDYANSKSNYDLLKIEPYARDVITMENVPNILVDECASEKSYHFSESSLTKKEKIQEKERISTHNHNANTYANQNNHKNSCSFNSESINYKWDGYIDNYNSNENSIELLNLQYGKFAVAQEKNNCFDSNNFKEIETNASNDKEKINNIGEFLDKKKNKKEETKIEERIDDKYKKEISNLDINNNENNMYNSTYNFLNMDNLCQPIQSLINCRIKDKYYNFVNSHKDLEIDKQNINNLLSIENNECKKWKSIYMLEKKKNEKKLFELYYIYIYIIIHIIKFYNDSFVDLKYYTYNCICEIASSYIPFYFTHKNIKTFSYYSNYSNEENKDINKFIDFINNINLSTDINNLKLHNLNKLNNTTNDKCYNKEGCYDDINNKNNSTDTTHQNSNNKNILIPDKKKNSNNNIKASENHENSPSTITCSNNINEIFSNNMYLISYIEYIYILLLIIRENKNVEKDRAICCIIRYVGFICKNMNFFLFNSINLLPSTFLVKYFIYLNNLIEKKSFDFFNYDEPVEEENIKEETNKDQLRNEKEENSIINQHVQTGYDAEEKKVCSDYLHENDILNNKNLSNLKNNYEKNCHIEKNNNISNNSQHMKLYHLFLNVYIKYEYEFEDCFFSFSKNMEKKNIIDNEDCSKVKKIPINENINEYDIKNNENLENLKYNTTLHHFNENIFESYSDKKEKKIYSNPIIIEINDIFNSNINKNNLINNPNNVDAKIILYLLSIVKDHIKNKITWNVLYAFKLIYNNFSFFLAQNFPDLHYKILDNLINTLRFTNVYKIKILSSLALIHIPLYYNISKKKLKELWETLILNISFFDVIFVDDKSKSNQFIYYYDKALNYITISKKTEYKYKCTLRVNICELLYICIYRSYIHANINTDIEIDNKRINCYEVFKKYTHIFNINNDIHIYNLNHIYNNHVMYYSFYNQNNFTQTHTEEKYINRNGNKYCYIMGKNEEKSYEDDIFELQLFLNDHFDKYQSVYKNLLGTSKNPIFYSLFLKLHYEIKLSLKKYVERKQKQ